MRLSKFTILLFKVFIVGMLLLLLLRIIFICRFGNLFDLFSNQSTFILLFFNAFRFDAQVLAYLMIPILPFYIAIAFIRSTKFYGITEKIIKIYFPAIYALVFTISIMDQQFFINFGTHFNPVFFEFANEEPGVLIRSIWNEHPVILIIAGSISTYYITRKFIIYLDNKILNNINNQRILRTIPIIFIIAIPLAIRGSVTTFPLRAEDIYISGSNMINDYVANSVFMLKKAYSEKKKQFKSETEEQILKRAGFESIAEAASVYYDLPIEKISEKDIEEIIFSTSQHIDNQQKHNVVLIFTESWSNRLIDFQTNDFDLLMSMKNHLDSDIVFRNFQSSTNGTIETVESFVVNTPYHPLFTSKYRYLSYPTTITAPFKDNGYNAEFISGIELSWRNLNEVLPNQQFDKVIGKYELLSEKPDAESNKTWGIYDHSMLNYVADKLENSTSPNFFLCLTSTSHTPFEFPDNYYLPELTVPNEYNSLFTGNKTTIDEYLKGYQYSNKALGDFMDRIKGDSTLSNNTVVIITGDHNIRMILNYDDIENQKHQFSVPLYIYLPPALKENIIVDTSLYGSHSDIIPTLVPLLFSNTRYLNLGQNLLDINTNSTKSYSINRNNIKHGDSILHHEVEQKAKAREALLKCYFQKIFEENRNNLMTTQRK